ncbi:MAG TPA: haloacid dehalogenase type II [Casimicrobiaceae bacterium]|jgi:2-haloacid dehalogenase|nr:haloacid dehalogenase type II [Casimicrobiaceae bacterium]
MIENSARAHAVDALVFDAYGTLFDVQSVASTAETLFPGRGAALAQLWRSKQLEYSWLQSLMQSPTQPREDFAAITAHALSYAAEALALPLPSHARDRMLDAYLDLSPFPDAAPTLEALSPRRRLILSNGTQAMLEPLAAATGLARHLDGILSVDDAGVYKPSPRVYQLAVDALDCPPGRIGFVSSNAWDAIGAKAFGFTVFWINRQGAPLDRHGPPPDRIIGTLADLPALLSTA